LTFHHWRHRNDEARFGHATSSPEEEARINDGRPPAVHEAGANVSADGEEDLTMGRLSLLAKGIGMVQAKRAAQGKAPLTLGKKAKPAARSSTAGGVRRGMMGRAKY
jgi:hypothetical protein